MTPSNYTGSETKTIMIMQDHWTSRPGDFWDVYNKVKIAMGFTVFMYFTIKNLKNKVQVAVTPMPPFDAAATAIIRILDFAKDIVYIWYFPHSHVLFALLLYMSICGPIAFIFFDDNLGQLEVIRTINVYFGVEKWTLKNFNYLQRIQVMAVLTLQENLVQMIIFYIDFFALGNSMNVI